MNHLNIIMIKKKIAIRKKNISIKKKQISDKVIVTYHNNDENDEDDDICLFPMLDLRSKVHLIKKINQNELITDTLELLIDVANAKKAACTVASEKKRHGFRIRSFVNALSAIKSFHKPISSGQEALKIDGIGKKIAKRIDEILETGTLEEIEETISDKIKAILDLCTVTGIGEARAKLLVDDYNVTSVIDLIDKFERGTIKIAKNQLTHHIALGLNYYNDIKTRIPYKEVHEIAKYLKTIIHDFNSDLKVEICGSYRRKKKTCGDIDVLISHPKIKTKSDVDSGEKYLKNIVNMLVKNGFIVGHLTENGNTKFMGICKSSPDGPGRRIDIRFIESDSFGAAMLYFTGSGTFNKIMRFVANERGFTLNEYGLYYYHNGVKEDLIPTKTEKDIFRLLKLVFINPIDREF